MNYQDIFKEAIISLKDEKRYRVFAELERIAGRHPYALWRKDNQNLREIVIWCSNDYLGMGHHPKSLKQ